MAVIALRVVEGADEGSEHPVDGELTIGRDPSTADLVLEDSGVSRNHARVAAAGDALTVEDLGSSNGTFVNGEQIGRPVGLSDGDEVQVGGTVLTVAGAAAATEVMGGGSAPTAEHPGPAASAPAPRRAAPRQPSPSPRPLGPDPTRESNVPALASVFLGPLSIFLVIFSTGAAFFVSLPCAIAAVVLASIGKRKVDRGEADSFRGLAVLGQVTGIIGIVLSTVALIAFLVIAALLDTALDQINSLDGIVDQIRTEIEDRGSSVGDSIDQGQGGDGGGIEAP
jgi:pSer/pThr/pTyr-binding forkhead associated (FHA) protein